MPVWTSCAALLLLVGARPATETAVIADWQLFTRADGLPHDSIRALCRFREQLWIGTDDGLALHEGGSWKSWTARDGLPWPAIHAIDVDPRTHDVWLGTWGGGLVRFSAGRFERFDQFTSGLAGDLVFAVRVIGPRIWAATNEGVSVFDWKAGTWDLHLERRTSGPERAVSAIAAVQGRIYAAAWSDAPWLLDESADAPDQRLVLADAAGSPEPAIASLAAAQESLWVAGTARLWRRARDEAWASRSMPAGLPALASCFAVSEKGEAWLGTEQFLARLARWESDDWERYDLGSDSGRVQCIAASEGEIWAGTSRGLLRGLAGTAPAGSSRAREPRAVPHAAQPLVLGILGPFGRTVSLPGAPASPDSGPRIDDIAVELAMQAAAAKRPAAAGPPLEVRRELPGLSPYAWGTPEDELLGLLRKHDPLALIGYIAPQGCISSATSLVTETPWINTSLAPPSTDELASPWIFRCPSNDACEQARLLDQVFELLHCRRPLMLRSGEPFADLHLEWWKAEAAARRAPVVAELALPAPGGDLAPLLSKLRGVSFDALLTWSDARSSAELVRRLREEGIAQPVLASAEVVCAAFLERVAADPGLVLAPEPCAHLLDLGGRLRFTTHYRPAGTPIAVPPGPSPLAWVSYDAACHVLEALEKGGVERESLRRILQDMRHARLARVVDGRWQ
jgi:ABC-type branched-subunit amino acid transport system substrate-binding protein